MKCATTLVLPVLLITIVIGRLAGQPTVLEAWLSIERGDARGLQSLLERGLGPDVGFGELTLLMHAADLGQSDCVGVLLRRGAAVDRASDCGTAALAWAARKGCGATVRCLLAAGADPNVRTVRGWTPLMLAAMSGDAESTAAIMAAGADAHARNGAGLSAVDLAVNCGHTELVELLTQPAGAVWASGTD